MADQTPIEAKRPFPCSYKTCMKRFSSAKKMIRHKEQEPKHLYCKICDVDCEDWEDLVAHKVAAMQDWLDENMQQRPDWDPAHITCEYCGKDFENFGGRRQHLEENHQAEQYIKCPGCSSAFGRAGAMITHLECGQCETVPRSDFIRNIQRKHVNAQIMEDPGIFMENVRLSKAFAELPAPSAQLHEDILQKIESDGVAPLEISGSPLTRQLGASKSPEQNEAWPCFEIALALETSMSMRNTSVGQSTSLASAIVASKCTCDTESYPNPSDFPPLQTSQTTHDQDIKDKRLLQLTAGAPHRVKAWKAGQASQSLFPGAALTPPLDAQTGQVETTGKSSNLLRKVFWDVGHPDWQLDLFVNALTNKYFCPFPHCDVAGCETQDDVVEHLELAHLTKQYCCPGCGKIFRSASALISHSEAGGSRCRLKESRAYTKFIDDFSGGFLKVDAVKQSRVFNPKTALVQQDHIIYGTTKNLFTGKWPEDQ